MSSPQALLHLLFNGARALDVVDTARRLGLLDALEPGPATLDALSARHGLVPARLSKFLDCLESLGLVRRESPEEEGRPGGEGGTPVRYRAEPGLRAAAEAVLGPHSQERDREAYAWRELYGHLPEVLRGEHGVPPGAFDWPPRTSAQVAGFEASMEAGLGPIVETFRAHVDTLLAPGARLLDVGGGNGALAAALLEAREDIHVDVYNLPACEPLVAHTRHTRGLGARLGFVAGDFLREPLPHGHDALSFVRVLHDWPESTALELLRAAHAALPPGGLVLVCEEFRTPERLAAQFFWSYFLMGVDACGSRLRELAFYTRALPALGFDAVRVLPGPFELLCARKP